jgi:hypothetical protein
MTASKLPDVVRDLISHCPMRHCATCEAARRALHAYEVEALARGDEAITRRDTPLAIEAVRDTDPAPKRTTSSDKLSAVTGAIFEEAKRGPPKSQG